MSVASVLEKEMWKTEIIKQKIKRREQRVLTVTNKSIDVEEYKRKQREKYEEEQRLINDIKREKVQQREGIEGNKKLSNSSTKILANLATEESRFLRLQAELEELNNKKNISAQQELFADAAEYKRQIELREVELKQAEKALNQCRVDLEAIRSRSNTGIIGMCHLLIGKQMP